MNEHIQKSQKIHLKDDKQNPQGGLSDFRPEKYSSKNDKQSLQGKLSDFRPKNIDSVLSEIKKDGKN